MTLATATEPTRATIAFIVLGKPATAGNKRAIPFKRGDGSLGVRVLEGRRKGATDHAQSWRSDVRDAARGVYRGQPLEGPIRLELDFIVPRPGGHYRANGELSKSGLAMPYPTTRPDTSKWLRAFEDALSNVVWADDSQIVEHTVRKVYGGAYETRVSITELA